MADLRRWTLRALDEIQPLFPPRLEVYNGPSPVRGHLDEKLSRCDLSPGLSSISIRSPPRRGCEGGSASRCAQASHPALELQIHTFPRACPPVRVFQSASPATQPPDHRHLQDKDTVRTDFVLR